MYFSAGVIVISVELYSFIPVLMTLSLLEGQRGVKSVKVHVTLFWQDLRQSNLEFFVNVK